MNFHKNSPYKFALFHEKGKLNDNYSIFISDNFTKCLLKSSIDLSYYYSNDGKTYYSCEDEKYKSSIECSKLIPEEISTNSEIITKNSESTSTNFN